MAFTQKEATKIAEKLGSEFNQHAAISVRGTLGGDYSILVNGAGRSIGDDVEKQIAERAEDLAQRPLTKTDITFTSGRRF